ncbi:MAG: hypothetical protein J0H18_03300 [Rhizobiales bacterium]|mgnify:FL=1|nr:hypothetical protein [Hyphomicrobiales bacterium]OJY06208.1 MAG: hypothetical protein BGP07_01050 [Rhizobiales bacterium 63-22]
MYGRAPTVARFLAIAMLVPLAACATDVPTTTTATAPAKTDAPAPQASSSSSGFFSAPVHSVDASLAQPCIRAAAAKYYLPEKVISAVNSHPGAGGGTDVDLKVDLRTAVCQLTAKGRVRAVIDTSPMSADQAAALAAAAKESAAPKKAKAKADDSE